MKLQQPPIKYQDPHHFQRQHGFIMNRSRGTQSQIQHHSANDSDIIQSSITRQFRITNRSPGSILRVKNKDKINSVTPFPNKSKHEELSFNPEQYRIRFQYQEIHEAIKFKDDSQDQDPMTLLNDCSFEELPQKPKEHTEQYGKFNFKGYLSLHNYLKGVLFNIQNRKNQTDVLNSLRRYIEFIQKESNLDEILDLKVSSLNKKSIRNSFLYQRLSMIILANVEANHQFIIAKKFLHNMASYALENYYLIGLIISKGTNSEFNELIRKEAKEHIHNKGFDTLKTNNDIIIESVFRLCKSDNLFYTNIRKIVKGDQSMTAMSCFLNLLEYYAFFLWSSEKAHIVPFLSIAPSPHLRELELERYTLVIDFLEVFCSRNRKFVELFRPFSHHFLEQMSQYYQIVVLSDVMPNQLNKLIALLDKKGNRIKHRLYRYHMPRINGFPVKELQRLGRDLSKVVLIDCSTNFDNQNVVSIGSWRGKKNDAQLAEVCPLLAMIVGKKLNVRTALQKYRVKLEQNMKLGLKYSNYAVNLD